MLHGFHEGGLELRRKSNGGVRLSGRFPYNSRAVLSDGGRSGRPRKEQFAQHAFEYTVREKREVHLLVGHSFDKPLASRAQGLYRWTTPKTRFCLRRRSGRRCQRSAMSATH